MAKKPKRLIFVLIIIGLLVSGPGCSQSDDKQDETDDAGAEVGSDTGGDGDGDSDAVDCGDMASPEIYEVGSPPPALDADPDTLCTAPDDTVESHAAGKVFITSFTALDAGAQAVGEIRIPDALRADIAGDPNIEIFDAYPLEAADAVIEDITASDSGFTFSMQFPEGLYYDSGAAELSFRVRLTLECDDGTAKEVESVTFLNLCDREDGVGWVSSGDQCTICWTMTEVIASPIPPLEKNELKALLGNPTATIVPVSRAGRQVSLFVENAGTEGNLTYTWKVSGGTLSSASNREVVWEMPAQAGPHLVQVSVKDNTSATVATLRLDHQV